VIVLRCMLAVGWLGVLAWAVPPSYGDDAAHIKLLIPAAAGMPVADFEDLVENGGERVREQRVRDQNLTLHFWTMDCTAEGDVAKDLSFFEHTAPRPYELAAEIGRGEWVRGKFVTRLPVTVIHADRIQAFTCDVVGDRATGDVSFESPGIYKGRIVYKAARSNGQWRIIEMAIPSRSLRLIRGDDGLWKKK
jgi:hypothetical protein